MNIIHSKLKNERAKKELSKIEWERDYYKVQTEYLKDRIRDNFGVLADRYDIIGDMLWRVTWKVEQLEENLTGEVFHKSTPIGPYQKDKFKDTQ